jgi:hypothetical protein
METVTYKESETLGGVSRRDLLIGAGVMAASVAVAATAIAGTDRAIATGSKLAWRRLDCDAEGVLDRSDGIVRFAALHLATEVAAEA